MFNGRRGINVLRRHVPVSSGESRVLSLPDIDIEAYSQPHVLTLESCLVIPGIIYAPERLWFSASRLLCVPPPGHGCHAAEFTFRADCDVGSASNRSGPQSFVDAPHRGKLLVVYTRQDFTRARVPVTIKTFTLPKCIST